MQLNNSRQHSNPGQYPFLIILPAFVCGILLQQALPGCSPFLWLLSALLAFLFTSGLQFIRSVHSGIGNLRMLALFGSYLLLGAVGMAAADIRNDTSWFGHFSQKTEALKVRVTSEPVVKAKTILVPATVDAVYCSGRWIKTTGALKLYLYRKDMDTLYHPGQLLIIPNEYVVIKNSGNPFAFDIARFSAYKGMYHQAFLSANEILALPSKVIPPDPLLRLKNALGQSIIKNVKDSTTQALIAATLLNERSDLDANLLNAYSDTGITHIIAISGMHIVLLAGCILWLLKIIPSRKLHALKYSVAILVVWLYVALTGFPPSAVRAAVMFSLAAIGIMLDRRAEPVNIWAAAGLLVLCYNPYWLYDVGIQLSFLAVLSILLFYTPVKNWFSPNAKIVAWLWDVVSVSIAAQILAFPLVIYYFHQFPLLGIPANVPAALYSTLLMFGALFLFILDAANIPAQWLGSLLTYLTTTFNNIIITLSKGTPQLLRNMQIDPFGYWLMMAIVIAFCMGCYYRRTGFLLVGLGFSVLGVSDALLHDWKALHQQRIVVYNTSKRSQADLFEDKQVTHLFLPDTSQIKYTLQPAMLGYRASKEITSPVEGARLVTVAHKRILFAGGSSIKSQDKFPIDYLILSKDAVFCPRQWFETFQPEEIILDASIPRWKAIQWSTTLKDAGANVHWVQEDGAWIYPLQ